MKQKPESVLKHGYLLKQGDTIKLQWHLRYFVLTKECLCYYRSEHRSDDEVPRGVIFFNDMSLFVEDVACEKSKTKFCLKIVKRSIGSSSRNLVLSTFCEDERNDWLAQLLLAKAMALVCDRSWIGGNDPRLPKRSRSNSSYSEKLSAARQALRRYGRRLSGSSRGECRLEEIRSKSRYTSWRHTMIDLSVV